MSESGTWRVRYVAHDGTASEWSEARPLSELQTHDLPIADVCGCAACERNRTEPTP